MFVSFPFLMTRKSGWWILPLCTILSACPFESTVPMEAKPVEPVDSSLLGYWYGIVKDGSDYFGIEALEISQKSDSLYSIIRYGKGIKADMIMPDTATFTGFTSYIGEQRFMNLEGQVTIEEIIKKKRETRQQRVFYVSALDRRNDTLNVRTVTEGFSTKKFFNRPADFKQLVTEMLGRQHNIYDDQYSLKYRKIPKPEQIFPTR